FVFFFQAEDGIRDFHVTGVQTCALPISPSAGPAKPRRMTMLRPGAQAPDFTATDDQGNTVRLSDFRGRPVVLYFYPKDHTPGCTAEACRFRDQHQELEALGAVVLGVSPDSVASHQRFRDKHGLPVRLLSDPDKSLAEAYGVLKDKKMFGRAYKGIDRTTFVIDPEGRIQAVIRGIRAEDHAD